MLLNVNRFIPRLSSNCSHMKFGLNSMMKASKMYKQLTTISEFDTYKGLLRAAQRCADSGNDKPIVFILGSTGVGKTKLSIELAQRFNGEIISADSMQVYKGLNIVTNKATKEERCGVRHHCFDYTDPWQQYTVIDFRRDASSAIHDIHSRDKLPIIVGGTNYYIECLLFNIGASEDINKDNYNPLTITKSDPYHYCLEPPNSLNELFSKPINTRVAEQWPKELLYTFLLECDPELAKKTSPNNTRKIIRFLQIHQNTNLPASNIYKRQKEREGFDGKPVFNNAIIFWLNCEQNVLNDRLDARCNQMMETGLLEELSDFHLKYNAERVTSVANGMPKYTEGIFQTIGLKEFHNWLLLDAETRNSYEGSLQLGKCIISFKTRTKSYVPKQNKWIVRRFLTFHKDRILPNIYQLDTTQPERWSEEVLEKAIKIFQLKLELIVNLYPSQYRRIKTMLNAYAQAVSSDDDFEYVSGQFFCDICNIHISGGKSYDQHLKSRNHQYNLKVARTLKEAKEREAQPQAME